MIERSIALLREAGDTVTLEESRALRAELSLEEGDPASAVEPVAREAIADSQKEKDPDDEANAWALLARALLAERQFEEAKQAADRAISLSSKSRTFDVRMEIAIVADRVLAEAAAPGPRLAAETEVRKLALIASEANKLGCPGISLEARLAAAEIALKTRSASLAGAALVQIGNEARAKGFLLIAQKAAAAMNEIRRTTHTSR